jgi:hypothetical protein
MVHSFRHRPNDSILAKLADRHSARIGSLFDKHPFVRSKSNGSNAGFREFRRKWLPADFVR